MAQVRVQAGDIVLCKTFNLTVPLSTQVGTDKFDAESNPLLVTSSYRNQDELWTDRPLGPYADLTTRQLGGGGINN